MSKKETDTKPENSFYLRLPDVLADMSKDEKKWEELQLILNPKPIEDKIESWLYCPFTKQVMYEPVLVEDGKICICEKEEAQHRGLFNYARENSVATRAEEQIAQFREKLQDSGELYLPLSLIKQLYNACLEGDTHKIMQLQRDH
jgi:hypothetical protein